MSEGPLTIHISGAVEQKSEIQQKVRRDDDEVLDLDADPSKSSYEPGDTFKIKTIIEVTETIEKLVVKIKFVEGPLAGSTKEVFENGIKIPSGVDAVRLRVDFSGTIPDNAASGKAKAKVIAKSEDPDDRVKEKVSFKVK